QGLLLMIPNMYKIAGELLPAVMHVACRTVGTHAQCIFADHSDVYATRGAGWAMLASSSVQECQDLAVVSHIASLEASLPFVHFFDGFRTSHEIAKMSQISPETIASLIPEDAVKQFRNRGVNPEFPVVVGVTSGPDTFFQCAEALNPYYDALPDIVEAAMDKVSAATGRPLSLFDYAGAEDAEHVVVVMGSGAHVVEEAVSYLNERGQKVGVVNVKLFRPFSEKHLRAALPPTCKRVTVLDRVKESTAGAALYLDVLSAVKSRQSDMAHMEVLQGRFGIAGKNFSPTDAVSIFENSQREEPLDDFTVGQREEPMDDFTVGIVDDIIIHSIVDDITMRSLPPPTQKVDTVPDGTVQCMFYGLGADGTVGANKEAISLIADFVPLMEDYQERHAADAAKDVVGNYMPGEPYGDRTKPLYCQGYFAYDAKKSGGLTVSHLRFGSSQIDSPYSIDMADYVACHNPRYLQKYDMVENIRDNGVFMLNSEYTTLEEMEKHMPAHMKAALAAKNVRLFNIDAIKVAEEAGLGQRVNMIMQTAFFALSHVLPLDDAMALLKDSIAKKYGKKGASVVDANCAAVDNTLANLHEIQYDQQKWLAAESVESVESDITVEPVDEERPGFIREWLDHVGSQRGNDLTVAEAGTQVYERYPVGTSAYEKRGIAVNVPLWDEKKCIQCGMCAFACPHAVIRGFLVDKEEAKALPESVKLVKAKGRGVKGLSFGIQASVLDCTGIRAGLHRY
ncbi:hypothetical protein KIPB_009091, partial [Kipferlia bialata]